jgi:TonB family protein
MTLLVEAAIRSSVLLALGLAIHATLRGRSAALRHAVVAASIALAAVVLPLSLAVPSWIVPVPSLVDAPVMRSVPAEERLNRPLPLSEAPEAPAPRPARAERTPESRAASVLLAGWTIGAVSLLVVLAVRTSRMMFLTARAQRVTDARILRAAGRLAGLAGIARPIDLRETAIADLIATWGLFRQRILLPAHAPGWSEERLHAVLCHELAHVRRRDWAVQMTAEVVRALYWFNPLIWLACRALRRDSELACDDQVLAAGIAAPDYADQLLALASVSRSARSWAPVVPMARRSTLERRIAAMLDARLDRRVPSRRAVAMTILLLAAIALPTAALRGQANPQILAGSVYDASGAVLPGVNLTLQDEQEFRWEAVTNASGRFEFPPVRPGKYVLSASMIGFREMKQEFTLQRSGDWDRAITLGLGQLRETVHVSASRTTQAAQPVGPQRIRVGGNIKAPHKLTSANPVYPESMRAAGRSGVVPIEAVISTDGTVISGWVAGGHVHPDFAKSALDAVRQWTFSPTLLNGVPVEVAMTVLVNFTIAD